MIAVTFALIVSFGLLVWFLLEFAFDPTPNSVFGIIVSSVCLVIYLLVVAAFLAPKRGADKLPESGSIISLDKIEVRAYNVR